MAAVRTGSEARSLSEQMAQHREALAALEREQEAERAAARAEEARQQRALLQGRAGDLARHEEARLEAISRAEQALATFVAACNEALAQGEAARRVGLEIAAHRGLRMHGALGALEGQTFEQRVAYAVSAHLSQIKVPGRMQGGRVGSLQLVGATMHTLGTWVETERGKVAHDMAELMNIEGAN